MFVFRLVSAFILLSAVFFYSKVSTRFSSVCRLASCGHRNSCTDVDSNERVWRHFRRRDRDGRRGVGKGEHGGVREGIRQRPSGEGRRGSSVWFQCPAARHIDSLCRVRSGGQGRVEPTH